MLETSLLKIIKFLYEFKNKQDKNGFELRYLHYSLGNFMFRNSYLSEMKTTTLFLNSLIKKQYNNWLR